MKPELFYYNIKFTCCHGGRVHISKGKGLRHGSTMKSTDSEDLCPFFVIFTVCKDGQHLECTKTNNEHNHPTAKRAFQHYSRQRRLDPEYEKTIQDYMKMDCNKKVIQQKIIAETGKIVILKDLHNIMAKVNKTKSRNNLVEFIRILQDEHGCDVGVCTTEGDNVLKAVFFSRQTYPEIVFLDATYKLTELRLPVFLLLVEDGLGLSEVVGVGLVTDEDGDIV